MIATPVISVVIPVYNTGKAVPELVNRLKDTLAEVTDNYEIILVEDRSADNSWAAIQEVCKKDSRVKGIKLSRNYGQYYAITAGLRHAKGDHRAVMDGDLKDDPKYIATLYKKAVEGADIVFADKGRKNLNFLKKIATQLFYKVYNYLLDNTKTVSYKNTGTYSMLNRKAANAFLEIKDVNRDYSFIVGLLGFDTAYVPIPYEPNNDDKRSYNIAKLLKHAIDNVTSQSDKLLRLSISIGFIIFISTILWAVRIVYIYYTDNVPAGYASIIIIELLGTGLILMSLGITGIYIGKISEQVKQRPLYIIDSTMNI